MPHPRPISNPAPEEPQACSIPYTPLLSLPGHTQVTFQELLIALRAVDCVSPRGTHARGFAVTRPVDAPPRDRDARDRERERDYRASPQPLPSVWVLEAHARTPGGAPSSSGGGTRDRDKPSYLIDRSTNVLYSRPLSAQDWPMPVGKVRCCWGARGFGRT